LSYKDQRELDQLPRRIEQLEQDLRSIQEVMAAPDFYRQQGQRIADVKSSLEAAEAELSSAYSRWEELESEREDG
jgi:ATP-binding cassette subfamily F protein uup